MKKIILPLVAFIVIMTSCKKDDDPVTCLLGNAQIVGSYKLTAATYKANAATPAISVLNNPAYFEPCEVDDVLTFNANNTFTSTDAGTTCTPSGTYSDFWSLVGTDLTVDGEDFTVSSFTCINMTLVQSDALTGETFTVVLTRQ